ncbi:hypothetical protein VNI00_004762 [Paramarasmius palmivorus]|uniref:Uncharacterized protein n=1 Tax=Paramarasmius palmivorus TaxID=297713 RepID=A0AAW0DJ53_9AGAR
MARNLNNFSLEPLLIQVGFQTVHRTLKPIVQVGSKGLSRNSSGSSPSLSTALMAGPTNLEEVKAILHIEKDIIIQQELSDLEQQQQHTLDLLCQHEAHIRALTRAFDATKRELVGLKKAFVVIERECTVTKKQYQRDFAELGRLVGYLNRFQGPTKRR